MKNILFIILISCFCSFGYGQSELKPVAKVQTEASLIKNSVKTTQIYKGLSVYQSKNHKLFIVKKSKNNTYYKVYLTN